MKLFNISDNARYECVVSSQHLRLSGVIDCIDRRVDNGRIIENIYEFKCVRSLKPEHYLQLALYKFIIDETTNDNIERHYYLVNIYDSTNMYEIKSNNLRDIYDTLVDARTDKKIYETDEEFVSAMLSLK